MVKRYAGLYCNGAEVQIKSCTITKSDDVLADYESQVTSHTLTWESQKSGLDIKEKLLGHTKDSDGVVHYNSADVAPEFGVSAISQAAGKWVKLAVA